MGRQTHTGSELQKMQRIYNPPCKRLFTLKEAAEYMGRSEWGMRDLIWKGDIPIIRQSGCRKIFIDIVDLDEFIERNKKICH
jgi:excisionase family DNA binding protein